MKKEIPRKASKKAPTSSQNKSHTTKKSIFNKIRNAFEQFSCTVTKITGSSVTFIIAFLIVIAWGICGPIFHYSDTWQLVINTGTTIITFLMVFLIQQAQNKDSMALQLKLNELIAATKGASNRVIDIEDLTEEDLKTFKKFYVKLSDNAEKSEDIGKTHSIDEADKNESTKRRIEDPKSKK